MQVTKGNLKIFLKLQLENTPTKDTSLSKYSEEDLKHSHKEEFEIILKNMKNCSKTPTQMATLCPSIVRGTTQSHHEEDWPNGILLRIMKNPVGLAFTKGTPLSKYSERIFQKTSRKTLKNHGVNSIHYGGHK